MSSKQFIDKLMAATGSRNAQKLFMSTGISPGKISLMSRDLVDNITIQTLVEVSKETGIKVSTLAGWWVGENI